MIIIIKNERLRVRRRFQRTRPRRLRPLPHQEAPLRSRRGGHHPCQHVPEPNRAIKGRNNERALERKQIVVIPQIFDIVNQIFPTAYVLNTGYWIYYSSEQGHCLCVCTRYGIPCRHSANNRHWADLSPVPEEEYKCINIPKDCFVLLTASHPCQPDDNYIRNFFLTFSRIISAISR